MAIRGLWPSMGRTGNAQYDSHNHTIHWKLSAAFLMIEDVNISLGSLSRGLQMSVTWEGPWERSAQLWAPAEPHHMQHRGIKGGRDVAHQPDLTVGQQGGVIPERWRRWRMRRDEKKKAWKGRGGDGWEGAYMCSGSGSLALAGAWWVTCRPAVLLLQPGLLRCSHHVAPWWENYIWHAVTSDRSRCFPSLGSAWANIITGVQIRRLCAH